MRRLEFFSLGGLLALVWTPRTPLLPWVVAAAALSSLSSWDIHTRIGRADLVLMLSLAGYELIIGLTEEPVAS